VSDVAGIALPSVDQWRRHFDVQAQAPNPMGANGYNVDRQPIDPGDHLRYMVSPWLELLETWPGCDVLEVGCGTGLNLAQLERFGPRWLVGMDVSAEMVRRYRGAGAVAVAEASSLPIASQTFDRLLMANVAQYFPSDDYFAAAVSEAVRVLRPAGRLLIADVPMAPTGGRMPFRWYSRQTLDAVVEACSVTCEIRAQDAAKEERFGSVRWNVVIEVPA
jgi:SAM-dependent methyltransferase